MIAVYAALAFIGGLAAYILGYAHGREMERDVAAMAELNKQLLDAAGRK